MKNLVDILVEKLSIDDIVDVKEFPINGTIKEIADFLKKEGFKEIKDVEYAILAAFNSKHDKIFFIYNESIYFADTSKEKVNYRNLIFLVGIENAGNEFYMGTNNIIETNKEDFLEQLNKHFGW